MLRMFIMACSSFRMQVVHKLLKRVNEGILVQAQVTEKYRLVTQVKKDYENRSANIY